MWEVTKRFPRLYLVDYCVCDLPQMIPKSVICTDVVSSIPGQTLVTGNVWDKSCTGGITLKNVLDLSVLHSYLNQINNKTLTPNFTGIF